APQSTSVSQMVSQMAEILGVPAFRLRLLREEAELAAEASVGELGLDIADILECVVMATEEGAVITLRLQGKDRGSTAAALAGRKVKFHFDGCKVTDGQTPAQLHMEDGDIIEVWT
uniref:NFATC2-interacting protein n=1 Tax=Hippocampus comes TaxID=109280 RepID=A0A3Q2YJX9_HIPCM